MVIKLYDDYSLLASEVKHNTIKEEGLRIWTPK